MSVWITNIEQCKSVVKFEDWKRNQMQLNNDIIWATQPWIRCLLEEMYDNDKELQG